jgi:hypothetical protein
MINKIKKVIAELKHNQKKIIIQNNELLWSSIFHDSIKGKPYLENLSLNIGRWAGNYAFFYVLNRILNDYQPKRILEFGLGESSKYVSTFLEHELPSSNHLIIEQSKDWKESFVMRFKLFKNSQVVVCPLEQRMIQGFASNFYKDLDTVVDGVFDLYIVDGPFGSKNFSRYDIVDMMQRVDQNNEFVIMLDDFNRKGEKDTFNALLDLFKEKNITIYTANYSGDKDVMVLGTEKYKFITTL